MRRSSNAVVFVLDEHRFTVETDTRVRHHPFGDVRYVVCRYVCACGFASQWRKDPGAARRQALYHALDGQLSAPL